MAANKPLVGVLMGSASDWEVMQHTAATLETLGIEHEVKVISAHRTPDLLGEYTDSVETRGIEVLICAAGGAAHLGGVTAAKTQVPVLGVPMQSAINGIDSLLSMVQMPAGIPVATLAIGKAGAINAALFAGAILANKHENVRSSLRDFRAAQTKRGVENQDPRTAVKK